MDEDFESAITAEALAETASVAIVVFVVLDKKSLLVNLFFCRDILNFLMFDIFDNKFLARCQAFRLTGLWYQKRV